jgi:pilus assembly protein CpaF
VHASNPRLALVRLETLCLMSGVDMPVYVARQQVASAIHVVAQIARVGHGKRAITSIAEVGTLDRKERYRLRTIFEYRGGQLVRTAKPSRLPAIPE